MTISTEVGWQGIKKAFKYSIIELGKWGLYD